MTWICHVVLSLEDPIMVKADLIPVGFFLFKWMEVKNSNDILIPSYSFNYLIKRGKGGVNLMH